MKREWVRLIECDCYCPKCNGEGLIEVKCRRRKPLKKKKAKK